jgi:hypothetical protein
MSTTERPRLTREQQVILDAVLAQTRYQLKLSGRDANVRTRDITLRTDRVGQVVGLICSNLVTAGMLQRMAPATYRLTRAGIDAAL